MSIGYAFVGSMIDVIDLPMGKGIRFVAIFLVGLKNPQIGLKG